MSWWFAAGWRLHAIIEGSETLLETCKRAGFSPVTVEEQAPGLLLINQTVRPWRS